MNKALTIDLPRIYPNRMLPQVESEFETGFRETDELMLRLKLQELAEKGFIRLATKSIPAKIPPKLPGKPLSEYLKEIRE